MIAIAILAFGSNAYTTQYFTEMESPVYKTKGNAQGPS